MTLNIHLTLQNICTYDTTEIRIFILCIRMCIHKIKYIALSDIRQHVRLPDVSLAATRYSVITNSINDLKKCNPSLSVRCWPMTRRFHLPGRRNSCNKQLCWSEIVISRNSSCNERRNGASSSTNYWYTNNIHLGVGVIFPTLQRIPISHAFL